MYKKIYQKIIFGLSMKEIIILLTIFVILFNGLGYIFRIFIFSNTTEFPTLKISFSHEQNFVINNESENNLVVDTSKTTKILPAYLSKPILSNSKCDLKLISKGRSPMEGRWFDFSNSDMSFYAYSAILDDRDSLEFPPVIRIIGLSSYLDNNENKPQLFCKFHYYSYTNNDRNLFENTLHSSIKDNVEEVIVPMIDTLIQPIGMGYPLNFKYIREYIFACPLPVIESESNIPEKRSFINKIFNNRNMPSDKIRLKMPNAVSILIGNNKLSHKAVTSCMPVEISLKPEKKLDFLICVQVSYGNINPVRLVEWIEMQKLLGVSLIGIYDMGISLEAREVLEYYVKQGFVELRNSDYIPHGYKQFLLHGSPVINDCMYRHMNSVKYLLVFDIDEFILPLGNLNSFQELFQQIEKTYGSDPHQYTFRNQYFFLDNSADTNEPQKYLTIQHRYKTKLSIFGYAAKTALIPDMCVTMHNHYCWSKTPKYANSIIIDVDSSFAIMHHYKTCHLTTRECNELLKIRIRDDTIMKYKDSLLRNINQTIIAIRNKALALKKSNPFFEILVIKTTIFPSVLINDSRFYTNRIR